MAGRVIAIDLGTYSVKLAFASAGWGSATLVDYVERAVPTGAREDNVARSAAIVHEILRERDVSNADSVYVAVPGHMVSSRVLEFGFRGLKRADLEKAVGAELEGELPYDMEDMVYTFDSLPRDLGLKQEPEVRAPQNEIADEEPTFVGDGAVEQQPAPGVVAVPTTGMRVFACAAVHDQIRPLLRSMTYAGEEPRGLIVAPTAFSRIVDRIESLTSAHGNDPVAIIDMGHQRTNVCVVKSGRVIFARTIERGGREVTEAVARAWNIPFEEAEKAKHSDGFIASRAEPPPSDAWQRIHDVLVTELGPLARELRHTFRACRAETGGTVAAAALVGGASRVRGMATFMGEQLSLPVSTLAAGDSERILGKTLADQGVPADVACCATGVVLDAASGGVTYDLRQGALAFRADFSFLRQKVAHLAAVALLIIAFAAGNAYAALYKLREAESVLNERIAVESVQATGKQLTESEILDLVGPEQAVEESPLPKMTAWDILLEINAKLPPRAEVTIDVKNLDIRPGQISLTATAKDTKEVGAIEKALNAIDCFEDVSKPNITSGPNDVKNFSVSIKSSCM